MTNSSVESVVSIGALCGEGPVWDIRSGMLHWVDIAGSKFHRFNPATGENMTVDAPYLVSAILPTQSDKMVAFTIKGVESLNLDTGELSTLHELEAELDTNRLNDGKVDALGRVWGGTMNMGGAAPTGALYRYDSFASPTKVDDGFTVSNGLGWNPDNTQFYFADSKAGIVYVYDFDLETGAISDRKIFKDFSEGLGTPDGLCLDSVGNLWIAFWDGWRVQCYQPDGTLVRTIEMPVKRPTSCCFGGEDLKTLYITSAAVGLTEQELAQAPLSGDLFAIELDVPGQQTNLVKQ